MRTRKSDDLGHVVDLNNQAERKRKQLLEETARKMAAEAKRIRTPKNSIATPVVCTANGTLLQNGRILKHAPKSYLILFILSSILTFS
jgi:hypothetical protein